MVEVRAASRVDRHRQIITYLMEKYRRHGITFVTAYDIARGIGMRPTSPAFRAHLKAAVDDGLLDADVVPNAGKWKTYGYSLPKEAREGLDQLKRKVAVKSKGVPVGQLSLF